MVYAWISNVPRSSQIFGAIVITLLVLTIPQLIFLGITRLILWIYDGFSSTND